MKCPEKRKDESVEDYVLRCHWAGANHGIIGRKIGMSRGKVGQMIEDITVKKEMEWRRNHG